MKPAFQVLFVLGPNIPISHYMSHCFWTVIFTSVLVNSDQLTLPSQVYRLTDLSIDWLSLSVKGIFVIPKWVCKLTDPSHLVLLANLTKEENLVETSQLTQTLFQSHKCNLKGGYHFVNETLVYFYNHRQHFKSCLHLPLQMLDFVFSLEPADLILPSYTYNIGQSCLI